MKDREGLGQGQGRGAQGRERGEGPRAGAGERSTVTRRRLLRLVGASQSSRTSEQGLGQRSRDCFVLEMTLLCVISSFLHLRGGDCATPAGSWTLVTRGPGGEMGAQAEAVILCTSPWWGCWGQRRGLLGEVASR